MHAFSNLYRNSEFQNMSEDNRVGIMTRSHTGQSSVEYKCGKGVFLFSEMFILSLGPIQSPIHWVSGFCPGVKQQGHDADLTPASTWCGYKITRLMLEHFLFKKSRNRNVVTLSVLLSPIPTPLHPNLPLLEAMLQVVF